MKKKQIIINIFLVCSTIIIMAWISIEDYKDKNLEKEKQQQTQVNYISQSLNLDEKTINEDTEKNTKYPKVQIEEQYKGYLVSAKLEIPSISLETYVLKKYSVQALNVSVTKFWGAEPNEIGNFCIAGHNFQNKNMFHDLKDLKIGDALFISDNNIGKVEYNIYDLYKVLPNDVSCLSQETSGKREVTLITCTNDSKERIIVKCKEVESID